MILVSGSVVAVLAIVIFLALIFFGMNIGLAMMLVGFAGYVYLMGPTSAFALLRTVPSTQAATYSLIVIPLFIMMGNFAYYAGLSNALFRFGETWLSRMPGSLCCASIAACAGFGAICGSCAATAATMGAIALPEMRSRNYSDIIATGSIAAGGTLGVMIPPSTPMIIYGILAECSIGALFAAGVIPGLLLMCCYMACVIIRVTKNKDWAPAPGPCSWKERFKALRGLLGVIILFGVTLGGMFAGFFSVNQSAAVGAFMAFIMLVCMRKCSWKNFIGAMRDSVTTFAMTFLIVIGAAVFCNFLAITNMPTQLADAIAGMHVSKFFVLFLMTIIYMLLGMVMDELPMIILTVPIFLPIILELGWSPVWFGIYVVMTMEMGAISPPVGLNIFVISKITRDIPMTSIYKGCWPFMISIWVAVAIIAVFPSIVECLPLAFGMGLT